MTFISLALRTSIVARPNNHRSFQHFHSVLASGEIVILGGRRKNSIPSVPPPSNRYSDFAHQTYSHLNYWRAIVAFRGFYWGSCMDIDT